MSRILVIDDEMDIADLIRNALSRLGHTVEIASNGRQGLRLFKDATFDLVVTDMCMPDLDGPCIVRHIRSSKRPLTPIMGISGTPWLLKEAGCDAVLTKPFRLQALVDSVKRLEGISPPATPDVTAFPLPLNAQPAL